MKSGKWVLSLLLYLLSFNAALMANNNKETALLGGGCFWCLEAVYQQMKKVLSVESGFSGGYVKNPAYRKMVSGRTCHAEVVRITFDPEVLPYEVLLSVFFVIHDPTTLNRQGADVGTQYRSVIFYTSAEQAATPRKVMAQLAAEEVYDKPLVTLLEEQAPCYKAEDYHHNYFINNPEQAYCQAVVAPRARQFKARFAEWRVK